MNRLAVFLMLCFALPVAHAATPFDETRALNADAAVSLDNLKGRIEVEAWDRAEIRIHGERGEGTEALEIVGDAGSLKVRIKYPEGGGWFGGWAGNSSEDSVLRVSLPVGASLTVDAVSASVRVRGAAGKELNIDNVSGEVEVDTAATEVEINTVSGDQRVTARSAEVTLETVSGDIRLEGEPSGRVTLEAVSGALELDTPAALRHLEAGVVSGDITLQAALQPGGRIQAESLSGDLEVVVPAGTSARLQASSFTGRIRSDQGEVETEEHGPGSSLSATMGSGEGRIELETFSGDLTIRSR